MFKKFSLLVLALVTVISLASSACSGEKTETEQETTVAMAGSEIKTEDGKPAEDLLAMAPPAENKIKIYNIENISARGDKSIFPEFTWKQDGKTVKFSEFAKNKVVFLNRLM